MIGTRVALTFLTLFSSLFSFAAYTLLLKHLGASSDVDALFYAASVPISVAGIASGVLLYLLPPRLTQIEARQQDSTVSSLGLIVMLLIAIASVFALIMWFTAGRQRFWLIWLAFANTAGMLVLATLATCVAQARAAYLATGYPPLATSTGLLLGSFGAVALKIEWLLVAGQWLGSIAGLAFILKAVGLKMQHNPREALSSARLALSPLRAHAIAITFGTIAFTLFQPIDAALCTQLASGSVSILAYAQRVLVAVGTAISLGAYAIAARTSHDALQQGGHASLCSQANREAVRLVSFGLATWVMYIIGGNHILRLLLSASTMATDDLTRLLECVGWMLLGVGPMAAMPYLFRVFYAMGSYNRPAVLGVCTVALYAGLAWCLLERFDVMAMAYAYSMVWWLVLALALTWLNRAPQAIATNKI